MALYEQDPHLPGMRRASTPSGRWRTGDRPAPRRQAPQPHQGAQAREDMARMERYLQRLREQSKGKEGA